MSDLVMGNCPNCNRQTLGGDSRRDVCHRCGYEFYYGDAHAQGDVRRSGLVNPGRGMTRPQQKPSEQAKPDWNQFDDQAFLNGC